MKYLDVTNADLPESAKWVEADPNHKDTIPGDFWIPPVDQEGTPVKGVKCIKVQDDDGTVFYMRFEQALRVYIQFAPEQEVEKSRISDALSQMIFFIGHGAKSAGYHEAVFDSKSSRLISFVKRLGFEKLEDTFRVKL